MKWTGHYKPSDTIEYSEDSPEEGSFDFLSELTRAWENASKLGHEEEGKVRRTIIRCGKCTITIDLFT